MTKKSMKIALLLIAAVMIVSIAFAGAATAVDDEFVVVSDFADLKSNLTAGHDVRLGCSITFGDQNLALTHPVTLDLNGFNLQPKSSENGFFYINMQNVADCFTLIDTSSTPGALKGYGGTYKGIEDGGAILVQKGVFNMYNVTIQNTSAWDIGGGVLVNSSDSTFNLYSGRINNTKSLTTSGVGGGGGVAVRNGGHFNMYGGSIEDCKTLIDGWGGNGGGVYVVDTGSTFNMTGGSIERCYGERECGGVYLTGGAQFLLDGGIIKDCRGDWGAGVSALSAAITMKSGKIQDCISGQGIGGVQVCDSTFTLTGGSIENCSAQANTGGVNLQGNAIFNMIGGSIKNCTTQTNGGGVCIYGSSIFNMTGGIIEDCTVNGEGGGVYADGGNQWKPQINLDGGTIKNCTGKWGAGVALLNGATFTMKSGKIQDCISPTGIGGVQVHNSQFTMTGGSIENCSTLGSGAGVDGRAGGVNVQGGGIFNMNGGMIVNCTANTEGGGVYVTNLFAATGLSSQFNLDGGIIKDCKGDWGAGVAVLESIFTMKSGKIENCTSPGNAGGVQVYKGKFTMTNGSIENCTATKDYGGVHLQEASTFTMAGGEIKNCTAGNEYGGVYVDSSTFEVSGSATIIDNTNKTGAQNNVYLSADNLLNLVGTLTGRIGVLNPAIPGNKFGTANGYYQEAVNIFMDTDTTQRGLVVDKAPYDLIWSKAGEITFANVEHGHPKTNVSAGRAGDYVTIQAYADDGYIITDYTSQPQLTFNDPRISPDGKSTFLMPNDEPVEITPVVIENGTYIMCHKSESIRIQDLNGDGVVDYNDSYTDDEAIPLFITSGATKIPDALMQSLTGETYPKEVFILKANCWDAANSAWVEGTELNDNTGKFLPDVSLELPDGTEIVFTNSDGEWIFDSFNTYEETDPLQYPWTRLHFLYLLDFGERVPAPITPTPTPSHRESGQTVIQQQAPAQDVSADPTPANQATADITVKYVGQSVLGTSTADSAALKEQYPEAAAQMEIAFASAEAAGIPLTNSKGAKAVIVTDQNIPGVEKVTFSRVYEISPANEGEKLTKVTVKVPKTDVTYKGLTSDDVTVYHFLESYNIWVPLEIISMTQDADNYYYTAATDGTSPFGVLVKKIGGDDTATPTTQPTQTQKSPAPFVGLIAGLGAALVIARLRK